jgi:hypothetical protein
MHIFYAVVTSLIVGFILGLIFGQKLEAAAKAEELKLKNDAKAIKAKAKAKL